MVSVILTSNLEFSQWNKVFSDPRLTAALVDRLIHHVHILSFTGERYRLKNSLSKSKELKANFRLQSCVFISALLCKKILQNTDLKEHIKNCPLFFHRGQLKMSVYLI
nr:ATP-binding protein [Enterococcus lemanii]